MTICQYKYYQFSLIRLELLPDASNKIAATMAKTRAIKKNGRTEACLRAVCSTGL